VLALSSDQYELAQSNISVNSQQPMRRLVWKSSAN
jgi:hypothetical protein